MPKLLSAVAFLLFPIYLAPQPNSEMDETASATVTREATEREVEADSQPDERSLPSSAVTDPAKIRQQAVARCLAIYHTRYINADVLRPWSIMHGLIAYGKDTLVYKDGKTYDAAEYLCYNGLGDDRRVLHIQNGKLQTNVGQGFQGHEGQLLAMLAQSEVPMDQPIWVEGKEFSVRDLVSHEQLGCQTGTELTFKLIGLSYYLDSETVWRNRNGQMWDISRMIYEEMKQPVNDGACGGSHRLMALSYAVRNRHEQEKPLTGQWLRARDFVKSYQNYALQMQNPDGSLSTNWFEGPGQDNDQKLRLYTTGHILEWLAYSLPQEALDDPQVTRSVDYLLGLLMNAPQYRLDVGPRGHALHALRLYEKRKYGSNSSLNLSAEDIAMLQSIPIQSQAIIPNAGIYSNASRSSSAQMRDGSGQNFSNRGSGRIRFFGRR